MSSSVSVCGLESSLKERIKKFRFRKEKNCAALMMKIDRDKQLVILEDEYEDCSLDNIRDELPTQQPRYLLYSYRLDHGDGRVSYPLCFIFVSPQGCKPEQQVMYTGSLHTVVTEAGLTKTFDVRSTEELTDEWLAERLLR